MNRSVQSYCKQSLRQLVGIAVTTNFENLPTKPKPPRMPKQTLLNILNGIDSFALWVVMLLRDLSCSK